MKITFEDEFTGQTLSVERRGAADLEMILEMVETLLRAEYHFEGKLDFVKDEK